MNFLRTFFRRLLFQLWYFRSPPWDSGVSPPELLAFIQKNPPGRALDLGCGTGTNVLTLARCDWEAWGVDFAPRAITLARAKARQAGVQAHFAVDDVTQLEGPPGTFDLVLDIGCLHNLPPAGRQAYLQRLPRLLNPGGAYLLYSFLDGNPHETQGSAAATSGLSEAEIKAISDALTLRSRVDTTERGLRPSVWLEFTR